MRELARAREDGALVRVHRRKHLETREGYVVGAGERWLLLANLDGAVVLDGYTALRVRDVTKVRARHSADFVRAALVLRGQWPPGQPPAPVALDSTRALLASLAGHWPLVTIHHELDNDDVCFIGEVQHLGRKTVRLREITPRATWTDPGGTFRLSRLTRIDVGGSYEQALIDVARSTGTDGRQ